MPTRCSIGSSAPYLVERPFEKSRLLTTTAIRHAQLPQPSPSSSRPPLQMPHDMPREDYVAPTIYTLSYLSRLIRYLLYGLLSLGAISLTAFEGLHLYIENVSLAAPSRESSDESGWEEETPSWTGGVKGGTDPKLGFKARHALRAAWICQEIGAGGGGSIGRGSSLHPTMGAIAGRVNQIDRGYELAEEYIDLAIREAKRKGLRFPPNLPARRPSPDSTTFEERERHTDSDPTATDLLLLKAGVLERISTDTSLRQARDLYEQVLFTPGTEARRIRLATKIGDLAQKTGEDGSVWWKWALGKAGLEPPSRTAVVAHKAKGWFSRNSPSPPPAAEVRSAAGVNTPLSPPVLRAAISALVSSEAQSAKSGHFAQASAYQDLALSLLTRSPATPTPQSDSAELHDLWLAHRAALIQSHKTSITHAQRQPAFELAQSTTTAAEAALSAIPDHASTSKSLSFATKLLSRDAHLLAAEANYIKGVLLEKQGVNETLEPALESFERAMSLSSADGEDVKGEEWSRYWRSYARVKDKMDKLLEK